MGQIFFYLTYRSLIWPLLRASFSILALFNKKIAAGLEMREGAPWLKEDTPRPSNSIWIHCASGEFEYAKPVITRIKAQIPDARVIVTYFSPTYAGVVRRFPGVDFSCPVPWDTPHALRDFIRIQKPQALLVARTDTWPEMLRQAKRFGLPTLLFSATLPESAGRTRNPLARWMSRAVFEWLDAIFCVSESDLAAFRNLGVGDKTRVAGDTRYDQVMERLMKPKPLKEELFVRRNSQEILVAGSTWLEDERVLVEVAGRVPVAFILVPHEPTEDHLAQLESIIESRGLKSVRYSKASQWPDGTILLVDQMGILAELYRKGSLAFVGGSFKKTVHSVMEPLATGSLTFVGPLFENNREAIEFHDIPVQPGESDLRFVQPVIHAEDFAVRLEKALKIVNEALAERIRREIKSRAGKSDLVLTWLSDRVSFS